METKPFSLQSPEQIAKDYNGNKQKIAEAMQMGVLDPTAGTLAAMFIDRMRNAAQAESAPQQSVAQQVFAAAPPQAAMPPMSAGNPAAGLGATPEAAAMPPIPGMTPGISPGMPELEPEEAPMMPPGMAMGGLASLPVPDDMFSEPDEGGYAGGGIVAFNEGNLVEEEKDKSAIVLPNGEMIVSTDKKQEKLPLNLLQGTRYDAPTTLGGFHDDVFKNLDSINEAAPRKTKRAEEYEAFLENMRSPEERKKRKQEDMWMALGQIGAKMAQTPGSILEAASAGMAEALPGIAESAKERRAEERAVAKELLTEERTGNKEIETRAGVALDMLKNYSSLEAAFQSENFKNTLARLGISAEILQAKIMAGASVQGAMLSAAAARYGADVGFGRQRAAFFTDALTSYRQNAATDPEYQKLFVVNPNAANDYLYSKATNATNMAFGPSGGFGGFGGTTPPPPPGAKIDK